MKPLTQEIDKATDALKAAGMDCTPDRIKVGVRVAPGEVYELADKALDAAIVNRLKARGEIIVDAAPRPGGRVRAGYWSTTVAEHEEQLRIQKANVTYVTNAMRAEEQAIAFTREWEKDHGYPPPFVEIAEDVDRVYRMNGSHGAPSERVVMPARGNLSTPVGGPSQVPTRGGPASTRFGAGLLSVLLILGGLIATAVGVVLTIPLAMLGGYLAVLAGLGVSCLRAPEGYQDDDGFHFGRDPLDEMDWKWPGRDAA